MTNSFNMAFETDPPLADENYIRTQIGLWNIKVTDYEDYAPANFIIRDNENNILGGILAYVWAKWLHVDILWLRDDIRGQGWGTKLLEAAHQVGREKGAGAAWLDTFSWQARPFYEGFGYEVVFEVNDFPPGHSRIFMQKSPL